MNKSLFQDAKVIVCVGSGGVGKTTVAASMGVIAAKEGKKVLVLTIDPAKRLAQTLGIEGSEAITRVPNQNYKGELFASVINHKQTFDEFVTRAAKKSEAVKKILDNRLYQQLSTSLSGSQEFTALEKLLSCYESGNFDLIILDTPPTKHAIDFLKAPQKLSALFSEGVAKWFRDPVGKKSGLLGQLIHSGTRQVFKILESLTGSSFIHELGDFFLNIEQWQGQLLKRTGDVHRLLISPTTHFYLVTAFDQAKLREAEFFNREINKGGYHLKTVILNRVFPYWLDLHGAAIQNTDQKALEDMYIQLRNYYLERDQLYKSFEDKIRQHVKIYRIPDLVKDVADIFGLENLGEILVAGEQK